MPSSKASAEPGVSTPTPGRKDWRGWGTLATPWAW